jgi:hypothetical protein
MRAGWRILSLARHAASGDAGSNSERERGVRPWMASAI